MVTEEKVNCQNRVVGGSGGGWERRVRQGKPNTLRSPRHPGRGLYSSPYLPRFPRTRTLGHSVDKG